MTATHKLGLTTSEAAKHLGVSLSTIRRWSDLGYLRGYRTPGGQRRFSVEQLDEFIESLESGVPRPAPPEAYPEGDSPRETRFQSRRLPAPADDTEPDDAA